MGFALIFIGILLAVSAVRGTIGTLAKLVQSDLTGKHSFVWWIVVVFFVGAIGYIPPFRILSRALLALVIISLFLTKGNARFFTGLSNQIAFSTGSGSTILDPSNGLQATNVTQTPTGTDVTFKFPGQ